MGRVVQSLILFLLFTLLSQTIGLDQAFLILFPPAIALTILYYLNNNIKDSFSTKTLGFTILPVISSVAIIILFPPVKLNEWYTIIMLQGVREELFFRFCLLGPLKECHGWTNLRPTKKWTYLLVNSLLFTSLHSYGTLAQYLIIFVVGMIFCYLFMQKGIVWSMTAHSLFNFYNSTIPPAFLISMVLFEKLIKKEKFL